MNAGFLCQSTRILLLLWAPAIPRSTKDSSHQRERGSFDTLVGQRVKSLVFVHLRLLREGGRPTRLAEPWLIRAAQRRPKRCGQALARVRSPLPCNLVLNSRFTMRTEGLSTLGHSEIRIEFHDSELIEEGKSLRRANVHASARRLSKCAEAILACYRPAY